MTKECILLVAYFIFLQNIKILISEKTFYISAVNFLFTLIFCKKGQLLCLFVQIIIFKRPAFSQIICVLIFIQRIFGLISTSIQFCLISTICELKDYLAFSLIAKCYLQKNNNLDTAHNSSNRKSKAFLAVIDLSSWLETIQL